MGRLEAKVAIITGGASGIGRRSVERFVEEGAKVVIADLDEARGEELARGLGTGAAYLRTDVREEADIAAAVALARERFGGLDCVFNNAGTGGVFGAIEKTPVEGFDATLAVLLRGVFLGIKHAAPIMTAQGSGSIISTASIAGLSAGWGPHVYSAAKAGVVQLTRSVAMELGESGVRVNCICPGPIATPIMGKGFGLDDEAAERTVAALEPLFAAWQPIPRAGVPDDIAHAAVYLASDESSFVNGHALVVDGGVAAGRRWSEQRADWRQLRADLGLDQ